MTFDLIYDISNANEGGKTVTHCRNAVRVEPEPASEAGILCMPNVSLEKKGI
ncbi:hypothetical protein EVJ58_g1411 [Rhodofomes roseus]|uniref:Uncharacterized protein n=1 Tax=Rhodofomes roseus TaxID=34475 RepID=A0A4Y9Z1C2_9APHY|nr:hypothetical protein EVJ58_g1411 [Rhodofomes roseus]